MDSRVRRPSRDGAGALSNGYLGVRGGHYFCDTETSARPFLAYTRPRIARNLLRFRQSKLPIARARACELDLRGALFPWRTIRGDEASAYHLAGTAQFCTTTRSPCTADRCSSRQTS